MAMTDVHQADFFTKAIDAKIKQRVQEVAQEEIAAAHERVAKRINAEIDKIALSLSAHYDVRMQGSTIIIEVRKLQNG